MQWPSWVPWNRQGLQEKDGSSVDDRKPPTSIPVDTIKSSGNSKRSRTDARQYTTTQTVLISVAATATTLALLRVYKTYLRRIPSIEHLKPGVFRHRSFYGYVTRVGDGDNFHLFHTPGGRMMGWGWAPRRRVKDIMERAAKGKGGQTMHVRLAGVDAPEMAHFGRPEQPYGKEALEWLRQTLLRTYVRVYPFRQDQYQRIVCSVFRRRWVFFRSDVGLTMLKQGLATVYEAKMGSEFGNQEDAYRAAEERAKQRKVGMWQDTGIVNKLLGRNPSFETPRAYKQRMAQQEKSGKTADMAK